MTKSNINIFEFDLLYQIFFEIKENLPFQVKKIVKKDLLNLDRNKSFNLQNSIVISNFISKDFLFEKNFFVKKNIIFFYNRKKNIYDIPKEQIVIYPISMSILIEKINVQLIKQRYDNQSYIRIANYTLDLNSRIISDNNNKLKLTERETDIILFLNDSKEPKNVNSLQNQVWGFSLELETHTVETHIYRLRKKVFDIFKDKNFIISHEDGYLIK